MIMISIYSNILEIYTSESNHITIEKYKTRFYKYDWLISSLRGSKLCGGAAQATASQSGSYKPEPITEQQSTGENNSPNFKLVLTQS